MARERRTYGRGSDTLVPPSGEGGVAASHYSTRSFDVARAPRAATSIEIS